MQMKFTRQVSESIRRDYNRLESDSATHDRNLKLGNFARARDNSITQDNHSNMCQKPPLSSESPEIRRESRCFETFESPIPKTATKRRVPGNPQNPPSVSSSDTKKDSKVIIVLGVRKREILSNQCFQRRGRRILEVCLRDAKYTQTRQGGVKKKEGLSVWFWDAQHLPEYDAFCQLHCRRPIPPAVLHFELNEGKFNEDEFVRILNSYFTMLKKWFQNVQDDLQLKIAEECHKKILDLTASKPCTTRQVPQKNVMTEPSQLNSQGALPDGGLTRSPRGDKTYEDEVEIDEILDMEDISPRERRARARQERVMKKKGLAGKNTRKKVERMENFQMKTQVDKMGEMLEEDIVEDASPREEKARPKMKPHRMQVEMCASPRKKRVGNARMPIRRKRKKVERMEEIEKSQNIPAENETEDIPTDELCQKDAIEKSHEHKREEKVDKIKASSSLRRRAKKIKLEEKKPPCPKTLDSHPEMEDISPREARIRARAQRVQETVPVPTKTRELPIETISEEEEKVLAEAGTIYVSPKESLSFEKKEVWEELGGKWGGIGMEKNTAREDQMKDSSLPEEGSLKQGEKPAVETLQEEKETRAPKTKSDVSKKKAVQVCDEEEEIEFPFCRNKRPTTLTKPKAKKSKSGELNKITTLSDSSDEDDDRIICFRRNIRNPPHMASPKGFRKAPVVPVIELDLSPPPMNDDEVYSLLDRADEVLAVMGYSFDDNTETSRSPKDPEARPCRQPILIRSRPKLPPVPVFPTVPPFHSSPVSLYPVAEVSRETDSESDEEQYAFPSMTDKLSYEDKRRIEVEQEEECRVDEEEGEVAETQDKPQNHSKLTPMSWIHDRAPRYSVRSPFE